MSMTLTLTSLPRELYSSVLAKIESRATLCNLARCSRQLYLLTIPHLYRDVTLRQIPQLGEQHNRQLHNFASLLIRRPDLAELVRNITVHAVGLFKTEADVSKEIRGFKYFEKFGKFEEPEDCVTSKIKKSEDYEYFEKLEGLEEYVTPKMVNLVDRAWNTAATTGLSEEEVNNRLRQLSQTHRCHHDLILALLLPSLLKVEKIVLDLKFGFHTHYLERMIQKAARRERPFDIQPPFETLKVFEHSPDSQYPFHRSISVIASLIKFPAIQKISASFGGIWGDGFGLGLSSKDLVELDSYSSSLASFDLTAYSLSTEDLGHISRAPKALKTLFYRISPPACINFIDIRHALEPQKNCIENLGLDYEEFYEQHYGVSKLHFTETKPRIFSPMASFISFNNLKVLKIAALFLKLTDNETNHHSLIDIFPPSLETLHLTRVQSRFTSILEAIEQLLAAKSPWQIPSLKQVILEEGESCYRIVTRLVDVLWKDTRETAIERLSWVAEAHGVSIELIEIGKPADEIGKPVDGLGGWLSES